MAPKRKAAAAEPRKSKRTATKSTVSAKGTGSAAPHAAKKSAAKATAAQPKAAPKARRGTKAQAASSHGAVSAPAAPPKAAASKRRVKAAATSPAAAATAPTKQQVDQFCGQGGLEVVDDFDATLSQTNIGSNNNKFYRLQLLTKSVGSDYLVWTRWGRVGVAGQSKMLGPFFSLDGAEREFKSKFKSKTGTQWEARAGIEAKIGKYVPVEIDPDAAPPAEHAASPAKATSSKYVPCTLPAPTQDLISLILDDDMFQHAMAEFEIDTDRFPLGQLSKTQVGKGQKILQDLKDALKSGAGDAALEQLSSRFYQTIPHAFGMRRPPVLSTVQAINAKVDMCNVLEDIEIAQSMLGAASDQEEAEEGGDLPEHPLDEKYGLLNAELTLLGDGDGELPIIKKFVAATMGGSNAQLANVWRVERRGEAARFAAHDHLNNRRLLWHGTNVAVVAAILKTGLRMMPHSGGRVGRGIYLGSEAAKSRAYTRPGKMRGNALGVMFLAEAALGREASISRDDPSLVAPPPGYDSVVARGRQEPDPRKDASIQLDARPVAVAQGEPVSQKRYSSSSFHQSEYLLYTESAARLRYCVSFDWGAYQGW